MREMTRRLWMLIVLAAISGGAQASFHLWTIVQLYSNADGTVQYIELTALASGEQFLRGHTITSSQGSTTHSFTFPADLPGNTATTTSDPYGYYTPMTSYKSMLIGTQGFAALGVVAPDYVVPNGFLFTNGGTVNYAENADVWSHPSLPTDGNRALNRNGTTSPNSPLNFAGDSGTIHAATANTPAALSGLWWNANESGWGVHFTQRGSNVFAAWYTYDTSGNPKWYVSTCAMAGGSTGSTGTCSGTLYEVNGPTFFGTAFDPMRVNAVAAGNLQVNFQGTGSASMTYTGVAGQTRTVAITRQPLSAGAAPPVNYTDIWWNPNESGWGMAITQ